MTLVPHSRRIVIIGGGFAGTIAAIKFLDVLREPLDLTLLEPRETLGRGIAYSTDEPGHLVNGAARVFSLYPEDPLHLARWLEQRPGAGGWYPAPDTPYAESFPPRSLFGTYVAGELARAVRDAVQRAVLRHHRRRAVDIADGPNFATVTLEDGGAVEADLVILANGLFRNTGGPRIEPALRDSPVFVANPLARDAFARITPDGSVLFLGASLTMLDSLISIEKQGFTGRYQALSRRGQLVQRNRLVDPWPDVFPGGALPQSLGELLRIVQTQRRAIAAAGEDWRRLVAAIRPQLSVLWASADTVTRARFASTLRPFWNVALHRAAPASYDVLEQVRAAGRFSHVAGTVLAARRSHDGRAVVRWRPCGGAAQESVVDHVVDSLGNSFDWMRIDDTLVRRLIARGAVRPHDTGYGIDADPATAAVIDASGRTSQRIFAVGHPLRGVAWESSSISEQVAGASRLAQMLTEQAAPVHRVA